METRTRPTPTPARLLDQVREHARYLHYSPRTEKAYLYWVRLFVRWHGLRHPRHGRRGDPGRHLHITGKAAFRGRFGKVRSL